MTARAPRLGRAARRGPAGRAVCGPEICKPQLRHRKFNLPPDRRNHGPPIRFYPQTTVFKMPAISPYLLPILLLIGSNMFMTLAWYGHLRFKESPLALVIVVAWLIAFVEYCMAVPANRWGSAVYTTAQLKTIQEVITLLVFAGFSIVYLKEPMTWNYAIGFLLIAGGAFFVFRGPL
jgi:uncharacterized protein (DUF486 family)